jgi:hypothetical protein
MTVARIPREAMVEQSVSDFVRAALYDPAQGAYTPEQVGFMEAFPTDRQRQTTLDKTYVAVGFTYDSGSIQAELGSDLKRRPYTIEFFVFGKDMGWGRNVALTVKSILDTEYGLVPLRDYSVEGKPVIDQLMVQDDLRSAKQIIEDPMAWEHFTWTVTVTILDEYHAGAG